MPYFSVPLLNNVFDAAFSSRIIVVPVEMLFNEFNWCGKTYYWAGLLMSHEFTFFFPLQANAMFLLAWKTVVYLTN